MFPFQLKVVSIPVKYNFRQIKNREIALFEGPEGWSEFSPFIEYNSKESATWLKAAVEAATKPAPKPVRNEVEVNATLPIRMDINYALSSKFSIGSDLLTSIKSYNLSEFNSGFYVQEESIRFAMYASYGLLDNALLLRAKVGLDTTDYGLYSSDDTIGVQVLTVQLGGDDRTRLNSEFASGLFFEY